MRLLLVGLVLCTAGCGGAPAAQDRLAELPGVRDARVSEEQVDEDVTATTATVDMEADATEPQIAAALEALDDVDAGFRDLLVDAGTVERPTGADDGPGVYRVDLDDPDSPPAATLARWLVAGTRALPDAEVSIGLGHELDADLGAVGAEPVAAAGDVLRVQPRLRDAASVRITSGSVGTAPGADLLTSRGLRDGRMTRRLRAFTRIAQDGDVPVTGVAVWDGRGEGSWLIAELDLGVKDPDDITTQRFGGRLAPLLRDQLDLLRSLPAGSRLKLNGGALGATFLDVAARPRPAGGETYGGAGWNELALRRLRAGG